MNSVPALTIVLDAGERSSDINLYSTCVRGIIVNLNYFEKLIVLCSLVDRKVGDFS